MDHVDIENFVLRVFKICIKIHRNHEELKYKMLYNLHYITQTVITRR